MPLPSMSLAVVGADHLNKRGPTRRFELAMCSSGEAIELRLEPRNRADTRAVAVYSCRGIQIGYLSAERCGRIGSIMRQGRELRAIFHMHTPYGCVIRVAFDGEAPVLPVARGPIDQTPDFYPDETYPDE